MLKNEQHLPYIVERVVNPLFSMGFSCWTFGILVFLEQVVEEVNIAGQIPQCPWRNLKDVPLLFLSLNHPFYLLLINYKLIDLMNFNIDLTKEKFGLRTPR